ncbi:MAG: adenosylcobalamin-dependent ribonucleoside-diphosphate reductase [Chloroflexi bacterium]|nr:adenosylcobalamin-dependent ribonucleoside-diphosphate reductase [Chloroflexota bacterium]
MEEQQVGAKKQTKSVDPRANGFKKVPLPPDLNRAIPLTDNARTVLRKRYLRRGDDGQPVETEQEMFWRVAFHVAKAEDEFGGDVEANARRFYDLLTNLLFFPNSPTFTGAGTPLGQLAACFVLAIDDDMGRTGSGIFETLRNAALIQQTGGGNGFSFSRLRPKGALVKSSSGLATGPVGFLRVYDEAFGEIAQGGSRRGANMAVLRVDHPDIKEFITCKTSEHAITNFNISVGITDAFMRAVEDDTDFELVSPQDGSVWHTVRAREIFDMIVKQAHHNGEPGVLFLDTANRENPVPHLYELESTNPCGEQFLGPNENCCLGSINLARHMTADGRVDWDKLRASVVTSTRFLEDVVSANAYVPAVPELEEAAHRVRRIGLGIMGLADMMYTLGVRYGSEEGQEFASQIMEFVRFHTMRTSIDLAKERGPFPGIAGSIYDPEHLTWQPPRPLVPHVRDWGRPALDWNEIVEGIRQYGIRNGAQMTIAPTGTISTVAGCEGYGCEPVFALAYIRYVNDNGQPLALQYTSPLFERALRRAGLDDDAIETIITQVNETGTCQQIEAVPQPLRQVFVVSSDVTAEEHVRMQAALQAFTDNAISKTCNFPEDATEDDVAKAYMLGWKLGCKGLTVYVTGSREKVVLETAETRKRKEGEPVEQQVLFNEEKKPRPRHLSGKTYRARTPLGTTYVTVNENGEGKGQPFEVFMHTSKAGSETAAVSEALGRLISYILRLSSPVSPRNRVKEIVRQLSGIGGMRSIGFGPQRVSSLPDGVAQVLQEYLDESEEDEPLQAPPVPETQLALPIKTAKLGDLCPECGAATLVKEEGCSKCYSCGFSEC